MNLQTGSEFSIIIEIAFFLSILEGIQLKDVMDKWFLTMKRNLKNELSWWPLIFQIVLVMHCVKQNYSWPKNPLKSSHFT